MPPRWRVKYLVSLRCCLAKFEAELMQILCFFTSDILAGRYDCKIALKQRQKNAQIKHTCPYISLPLGILIHKGYSSQYQAAHNCTTSGFLAAFKFWGLLGSTSYIKIYCLAIYSIWICMYIAAIKLYFALWLEDQEGFIVFSVTILHKIWVKFSSKCVLIQYL
jgi:hypothetical protein